VHALLPRLGDFVPGGFTGCNASHHPSVSILSCTPGAITQKGVHVPKASGVARDNPAASARVANSSRSRFTDELMEGGNESDDRGEYTLYSVTKG